jgi:hypothetical protein
MKRLALAVQLRPWPPHFKAVNGIASYPPNPLSVRYFSARSGSVPGYDDGEGLNLELPLDQSASVCGVAENRSQHCLRRNDAIFADTVYLVGRNLSHLRADATRRPY